MSAEILRRAASLMRERAGRANRAAGTSGRWSASWDHQLTASDGEQLADCLGSGLIARHIASWHPAVALAVADLLNREAELKESADEWDAEIEREGLDWARKRENREIPAEALALALTYLEEQTATPDVQHTLEDAVSAGQPRRTAEEQIAEALALLENHLGLRDGFLAESLADAQAHAAT